MVKAMTDYYAARGTNHTTIHTDRDCKHLEESKIREARPDEIDDLPVCRRCRGAIRRPGGDKSHFMALKEAANE